MYSASSSRHHSSSLTSDIVAQCQTEERTVGGQHRPELFVMPMLLCRFVTHPHPPATLSYGQAARRCLDRLQSCRHRGWERVEPAPPHRSASCTARPPAVL